MGQIVECRREVGSDTFVVRSGGTTVAVHVIAPAGSDDVWDGRHNATAQAAALGHKPELVVVSRAAEHNDIHVDMNNVDVAGDYSVECIDLDARVGGMQ